MKQSRSSHLEEQRRGDDDAVGAKERGRVVGSGARGKKEAHGCSCQTDVFVAYEGAKALV